MKLDVQQKPEKYPINANIYSRILEVIRSTENQKSSISAKCVSILHFLTF